MSILKRRARWFLTGYNVTRSMEWMFWPLGYRPAPTPATDVPTVIPSVSLSEIALQRQFSITNGPEFMEQLRRLGAVREQ